MQRKVAGAEQVLRGAEQVAAMGLMGLGGLLAVVGGLLFIVVVMRAMAAPHGHRLLHRHRDRLYFAADWLLDWIERRRGARFENRQVVFFAIILPLALLTFWAVRMLQVGGAG